MALGVSAASAQDKVRVRIVTAADEAVREDPCIQAGALEQRIGHFSKAAQTGTDRVTIVLQVSGPNRAELRLARDGRILSRRVFSALPRSCADRLDVLALAAALALDAIGRGGPAAKPAAPEKLRSAAAHRAPDPQAQRARRAGATATGNGRPKRGNRRDDRGTSRSAARPPITESVPEPESGAATAPSTAERVNATRRTAERVNATRVTPEKEATTPTVPAVGTAAAPLPRFYAGGRRLVEALPWSIWVVTGGAAIQVTRSWAVELGVLASPPSAARLGGGTVTAWLAGGELLACLSAAFGRAEAGACLGFNAGGRRFQGRGFPQRQPADLGLWAAGTARLAAQWPLVGPVSLRIVAQGQLNLTRPELQVRGVGIVDSTGPVGAALGADLLFALD